MSAKQRDREKRNKNHSKGLDHIIHRVSLPSNNQSTMRRREEAPGKYHGGDVDLWMVFTTPHPNTIVVHWIVKDFSF